MKKVIAFLFCFSLFCSDGISGNLDYYSKMTATMQLDFSGRSSEDYTFSNKITGISVSYKPNSNGNVSEAIVRGDPENELKQIKLNLIVVYLPLQDTLKLEGKKYVPNSPSISDRTELLFEKIINQLNQDQDEVKSTDFIFDGLKVHATLVAKGKTKSSFSASSILIISLSIP